MEGEGYDQQWDEEDDEWDENPRDEGGGVPNTRSYSESYPTRHATGLTHSERLGDRERGGVRSRSPAGSERSAGFGRAGTVRKDLNR